MRSLVFLWFLLLSLGSLAGADYVLVDKTARTMRVMQKGETIALYDIALGGNPSGHKKQEGDQRTPEGTYVLDYKNEESAFYRSMHISYPNEKDEANARILGVSPGGMIMVHGQKNGFGWLAPLMQLFDWTDGCIAIRNREMDEFMALVAPGTPIEIRP